MNKLLTFLLSRCFFSSPFILLSLWHHLSTSPLFSLFVIGDKRVSNVSSKDRAKLISHSSSFFVSSFGPGTELFLWRLELDNHPLQIFPFSYIIDTSEVSLRGVQLRLSLWFKIWIRGQIWVLFCMSTVMFLFSVIIRYAWIYQSRSKWQLLLMQ